MGNDLFMRFTVPLDEKIPAVVGTAYPSPYAAILAELEGMDHPHQLGGVLFRSRRHDPA